MTDKERERLCAALRHLPAYLSEDGMQAAEEIERLAALAQSNAEPVCLDKFKRGRIAHKAVMAIRPETVGDGEYWRLRCAINDALREELAQSDAEPVSAREDYEASCGLGFKMPPPRPDAARSEIERLVQERKMERLVQERDSALATLKAHGIMK
jgi:hypothetical protein